MNARTVGGSLLGFILVILLYAKLADLAEGATTPKAPPGALAADSTVVANTVPGAATPDAATAQPEQEEQSSSTSYWLIGSCVVLLLGGLVYGRVEARNKLQQFDREEKDPPFLEELLKAYPDKISELLNTPRQIKRFSSKVRLQHNLMHNMARQQQTRFVFSEEEQILSFMYLLLIEYDRETAHKLVNSSKPEFKEILRKIALEEYDYRSFLTDDRIRGGDKAASMLEAGTDQVLVQQLCRLNLGALV